MQGRTVIAIAHRLSTLSSFDRIIALEAGRIVEDGPAEQLLFNDGMYSRFATTTIWLHAHTMLCRLTANAQESASRGSKSYSAARGGPSAHHRPVRIRATSPP